MNITVGMKLIIRPSEGIGEVIGRFPAGDALNRVEQFAVMFDGHSIKLPTHQILTIFQPYLENDVGDQAEVNNDQLSALKSESELDLQAGRAGGPDDESPATPKPTFKEKFLKRLGL